MMTRSHGIPITAPVNQANKAPVSLALADRFHVCPEYSELWLPAINPPVYVSHSELRDSIEPSRETVMHP